MNKNEKPHPNSVEVGNHMANVLNHHFHFIKIIQNIHINGIAGLFIERSPVFQLSGDEILQFHWRLVLQERTYSPTHFIMIDNGGRTGLEVDGNTCFIHIIHIVEKARSASATG